MTRINSLRTLPLIAAAAISAAALASPAAAASSHHTGGANVIFADGSVRFDPAFQGGVVVAAGDVDSSSVTGRITAVAVDPSDPSGSVLPSITDIVIDPFDATR